MLISVIVIPISAFGAISRVEVTAPVSKFTPGNSYQFEYRYTPSNEKVTKESWSVSGSGATINSTGKLTLSSSAKGVITVTVTLYDSNNRSSKGMLSFVVKNETTTKKPEQTTRRETTTKKKETTTKRRETTTRKETTTDNETTSAVSETTTAPSTTSEITTIEPQTTEQTTKEEEKIASNEILITVKKGETSFEWENEDASLTNLFLSSDGGKNYYLVYSGCDNNYTSKTLIPDKDFVARIVMQDAPLFRDTSFHTADLPLTAKQIVLIVVPSVLLLVSVSGTAIVLCKTKKKKQNIKDK